LRLVDVALVLARAFEVGAKLERAARSERIVGRNAQLLAGGDALVGLRQPVVDLLEIREQHACRHRVRDAAAHSPTFPVREMSVSSMSSIAVSARAAAW